MSAVRFSILPMKTSGLGTHYRILPLQAKLGVLRSRMPDVQGASLLAKAFCFQSPNSCPDKGDLWLLQPGCQQKHCSYLGSETSWGRWIRGISLQSQVTLTLVALIILQSQHNYFWATWAKLKHKALLLFSLIYFGWTILEQLSKTS